MYLNTNLVYNHRCGVYYGVYYEIALELHLNLHLNCTWGSLELHLNCTWDHVFVSKRACLVPKWTRSGKCWTVASALAV